MKHSDFLRLANEVLHTFVGPVEIWLRCKSAYGDDFRQRCSPPRLVKFPYESAGLLGWHLRMSSSHSVQLVYGELMDAGKATEGIEEHSGTINTYWSHGGNYRIRLKESTRRVH